MPSSEDDGFAVYVSCEASGEVRVFRLDAADGTLRPLQTLAPGGTLMPMAPTPDGTRLHVARRSAPFAVLTYAIDPSDGTLALLGEAPLPDSMAAIATDRAGRRLFSASYGGGVIASSPIDAADGRPGAADQVLAIGAKAHCVRPDPSNRYVLATALGDGVVRAFALDADGRFGAGATLVPHPGASPRHVVFARDGRRAYVLGELDAAIDVLDLDSAPATVSVRQTVAALADGEGGAGPWAADLHLTPDGHRLYVSERRTGCIVGFTVDPADGTLVRIGAWPVEAEPRGFAIAPDGRWLVVAGQASHHVAVHAIDAGDGTLRLVDRQPCGARPNWVEILALG